MSAMSSSGSGPSDSRKVAFGRSSASRSSAPIDLAQASSTSTVPTRRHSLFGTEDRVVLDVGSKYTKIGFSGEPRPRAIVLSASVAQPPTSFLNLQQDCLWDLDLQRCNNDVQRKDREALLLAQLSQLIQIAYTHHLMVDPKQRKVFVVENPLMPTLIKDMLCKILFDNLKVPSVSFLPAPLLSVVSVGKITGLVVDVGYLESTVTPVFYGRPMLSHIVTSPRAGRRLNHHLKTLLLRHGKFIESQHSLQATNTSLGQRLRKIDEFMLTDEVLEEVKAKAVFVRSQPPAKIGSDKSQQPRYARDSASTPFTFAISPARNNENKTASMVQRFEAASSSTTSSVISTNTVADRGVIAIPGWVRDQAAELLLDSEDFDESDVVQSTLRVLSALPIDLRRTMCENVLITGGTAMLPGFATRFRAQLTKSVMQAEMPGGTLSISKLVPQARLEPASSGSTPLHEAICVLNDPWPDSLTTRPGAGSGCAPAFVTSLLPWIGASLIGSLKTSALAEISREAYDQAVATVLAAGTSKSPEPTGPNTDAEASPQRPAMRGSGSRGSFVGVMGGLETGAYGGLSAVSRHLVGVGPRHDPASPERSAESRNKTVIK